jgi:hypothetical protein
MLMLVATALALAGCRSVYTVPGSPRELLRQQPPPNAFVVRTKAGEDVRLGDVTVRGDSVVGVRSISSGETVAIAIDDILSLGKSEVELLPTIMLLVVVLWGTFIVVASSIRFDT